MVCQETRTFQASAMRKAHPGTDPDTLEIRAVKITARRLEDAPILPELLNQIPDGQPIGKITAPSHGLRANRCHAPDGAHDTRGCHAAIAGRSACAVIPARKNARPWLENAPGAQARHRQLNPPPWPHDQAAVERVSPPKPGRDMSRARYDPGDRFPGEWMRCFKLLGERVMARDFDRQVAELQIRGSDPEPVHGTWNTANSTGGMTVKGKGKLDLRLICATEQQDV